MARGRSTLILFVVLVGLVAYIYFVESKRTPSSEAVEAKEKVFTVESDKIDEIRVKAASGETTALKKGEGGWQITEPVAAQADETEVSSIASNLSSVEVQRLIEEKPPDVSQYGLQEPRVDVAFKAAGDKEFRHLLIGEKTATGGDLYARRGGDEKVFLISAYLDSTFNKTTFELREKSALKFERDKVDSIEIATTGQTVVVNKVDNEWKLTKPVQARGDYGTVEGVIGRLNTAQMKAITVPEAADLKPYGLDRPEVTATIGMGSSRATLLIGQKAADDTVYAKDSSRPMVFTVETSLVDELKKAPGEYRRKDLFESRSFNATRVEAARGAETLTFEKVKGSGEKPEDQWRLVSPARDVERDKVESMLSKFSNLRALSFADDKTKTGLESPVLTIVVSFDEGKKQERVRFGKVGTDTYAARADEPGAAKIDTSEFDQAVKALDELKAAPAPTAQ